MIKLIDRCYGCKFYDTSKGKRYCSKLKISEPYDKIYNCRHKKLKDY